MRKKKFRSQILAKRNEKPKNLLKYIKKDRVSINGVKYTFYAQEKPKLPRGFNHQAKRRLVAMMKRKEQGRDYYTVIGRKRHYFDAKGKPKNRTR